MDALSVGDPGPFAPSFEACSRDSSTPFPLNGIDISTLSDEQLIAAGKKSPILYSLWSTRVVRLSVDLVMKYGEAIRMQEIEAMQHVLSRTTIRTPKLHRYFITSSESSSHKQCGYLVMDYVDGDSVEDVWHSIAPCKRVDIVKQVADMILQLQTLRFEQPGPLGGGGGSCRGFWFSDYEAGPFDDKEHFNRWFTSKLDFAEKTGRASNDIPAFNYASFMMVHHDLQPYNLILDRDGHVWIIDWGNAGAYPAIFEAAVMCDSRWEEFNHLLLPLIYNDPDEREQLMSVRSAISTFPRQ